MLSIGKLVAGQEAYYEKQVAQGSDDYYTGKGEAQGVWRGSAAAEFGLEGVVESDQFSALIAGNNPTSGEPIRAKKDGSRSTQGGSKVAAYDLTFSAPKSVSILYAIGGEEASGAMLAAHEAAVGAGLSYLEREACRVRRGAGGGRQLEASGFISASYRHRMSREQDPQLHTHVVTANIARGSDGRYSALDGRELYRHAKAAGTIYQAVLRAGVRERMPQLWWGPVREGMAELAGMSKTLLSEFSQRRQKIRDALGKLGLEGKSASERAALSTRSGKSEIATKDWREFTYARAAEHGFGRDEIAAFLSGEVREPGFEDFAPIDTDLSGELFAADGLTEDRNSFAVRDVAIAVASAHPQGGSDDRILAQVRRVISGGPLRRLTTNEERYTTEELLSHERLIVEGAERRRDEGAVWAEANIVSSVLGDRAVPLTDEQAAAVRGIATSGHGVETIEALAGTGKTTTAGALREAFEAQGVSVVGTAHTARAVRELQERAGIERSATIASVRMSLEQSGGFNFPSGAVLILDEASMASTRDVAYLFAEAEAGGVKVVAIGDSGQMPSVEAGGWLGSLTRRLGSHHLTEVMRQRDVVERRLLARLHGGSPVAYIREKYKRGELRTHKTHESAEAEVVKRWAEKAAGLGGQAVMITRDNNTRSRLNRAARLKLQERGELGGEIEIGGMELAVGDRVIARRNDRGLDVDNGMRGTVVEVRERKGEVRIETDGSGERVLGAGYVQNNLEHAYALTGHGLQGGTVEWAAVVGETQAFSLNWSYIACSRAREPVEVHVIDEDTSELERDEVAPKVARSGRERLSVRLARRMRARDDEDLALDQLPESSAASRIAERSLEPQELELERGLDEASGEGVRRSSAHVRQLFEDFEEIQSQLAALPLRQAKALEQAQERSDVAARERDEQREVLKTATSPNDCAIAEHNLEQLAKAIEREREKEAKLREVVPDPAALSEQAALLRARATEIGREIGVSREAHLEAAVIAPDPHVVRALGRPPGARHERSSWEHAVRAIERYRFDHQVESAEVLGELPPELLARQRKAFAAAAKVLAGAQRRLGIESDPELEVLIERGVDVEI